MDISCSLQGILLIDKPPHISSFDVIRSVRRTLNIRKIGHAGTLDPFASGLLVLAMGEGTKVLSELILAEKEYSADIIFGATSSTDDREGVLSHTTENIHFSKKDLLGVFPNFLGEIDQIPPLYSALKISGKRACDRMRAGENIEKQIEKKKRKVKILEIEVLDFEYPRAKIRVHCGSGTYIRSLIRDIGSELRTGAYANELRRTKIGNFDVAKAKNMEDISENDILELKPEFFPFPSLEISEKEEEMVRLGKSFFLDKNKNFDSQKISLFRKQRMIGFAEIQKHGEEYVVQPRKLLTP
ncbi:tRNA pseudouridine(55) synthase TruB [Candidatus Peregrinibacteria bacterium]|nr:tRNA pseudouridine(55) synthase TruB [Candidatus Peregrinibacteria bacterium]